jgi:hypothetical protein
MTVPRGIFEPTEGVWYAEALEHSGQPLKRIVSHPTQICKMKDVTRFVHV